MSGVAAVALGGALGAVARYLISVAVANAPGFGSAFPWATLTVNLAGCLGSGLAWANWSQSPWFHDWGRAFLVVGVLGGFTTFSAFSFETLMLADAGRWGAATAYVTISVVGCLLAAWLGQRLMGA